MGQATAKESRYSRINITGLPSVLAHKGPSLKAWLGWNFYNSIKNTNIEDVCWCSHVFLTTSWRRKACPLEANTRPCSHHGPQLTASKNTPMWSYTVGEQWYLLLQTLQGGLLRDFRNSLVLGTSYACPIPFEDELGMSLQDSSLENVRYQALKCWVSLSLPNTECSSLHLRRRISKS